MTQEERLDYLIRELEKEHNQYVDTDSLSYEEKQKRLRGLFNIRAPKPVTGDILMVQDEYLKYEIEKAGITDYRSLRPVKDRIYLFNGDITTLKCDAIVNAANSILLGCFIPNHLCVDNCIHTFAGMQLRLECYGIMQKRNMKKVETAEAILTNAYNLPCSHVIHTVGPIVSKEPSAEDAKMLSACYRNCLELAVQNNIKSVAFSSISTSSFGYPIEEAAVTAVETVLSFVKDHDIDVIFDLFSRYDYRVYQKILA